jgi:ferritin-like metal-binding protein YciE
MEGNMARSASTRKRSPDASELLMDELAGIYSAETQLTKNLPRFSKAVQSKTLRRMIDTRLKQGERILSGLEKAFERMDGRANGRKNVAAEGLINDAREHVQKFAAGPALDAAMIGAIQKTEHYCIGAWGTARALAEATQEQQVVRVMERALDEGWKYDEQMTGLAESEVNPALLAMTEDMEEEGEGRSAGSGRSRRKRSARR